jgi:hypothetical protein
LVIWGIPVVETRTSSDFKHARAAILAQLYLRTELWFPELIAEAA